MNPLRACSLLLLILFVAACTPTPPTVRAAEVASTTTFKITVKPDPTGTPEACDSVTGNKCVIKIGVAIKEDQCTVTMKEYVTLGSMAAVSHVEWELPTGFKFCTRNGDGVFADNPATSPPYDPDPQGPCKQSYGWKRNASDSTNYAYFLRFRNDSSTLLCVKDPWFKNG